MFCFRCKEDKRTVTMTTAGTMVTARQNCAKCGDSSIVWRSQPLVFDKQPLGNMLLSFAILMAGATINKTLLVFRHMGLSVITARIFFRHQRNWLFPVVLTHWQGYQKGFLNQLKNIENVVWSGDGRFDSMGHSAKYGVYSMFNCNLMKILHFELVQVHLMSLDFF